MRFNGVTGSVQPVRKMPRLAHYDYRQAGAYFVTLCTHDRKCLFGIIESERILINAAGSIVSACWQTLPQHFPHVQLDEFAIMPNHFHAILFINIAPAGTRHAAPVTSSGITKGSLGAIIGAFKSAVTKQINLAHALVGVASAGAKVWQRNYYEHVIRNEISLGEIRQYIVNNPAAWEMDELNPQRARHASPLQLK